MTDPTDDDTADRECILDSEIMMWLCITSNVEEFARAALSKDLGLEYDSPEMDSVMVRFRRGEDNQSLRTPRKLRLVREEPAK